MSPISVHPSPSVPAVSLSGRVYVLLPFIYYVANIGTAVADAYGVGKVLYPERFQGINLPEKADAVYKFLVGAPVYKEVAREFGQLMASV